MLKILKTLFLMCFVFFNFSSCSAQDNSNKTIEDLIEYFSAEFEVEFSSVPFFTIIGAIDGRKIYLNQSIIEIYKYDLGDKSQKAFVDVAEKTGYIGNSPVIVNGSFVLYPQNHPEKDKVVNSFKAFGKVRIVKSNETVNNIPNLPQEEIQMPIFDILQITKDYADNEYNAKNFYEGKLIKVKGIVKDIMKFNDPYNVIIAGHQKSSDISILIHSSELNNISIGREITFQGICYYGIFGVYFKDILILDED